MDNLELDIRVLVRVEFTIRMIGVSDCIPISNWQTKDGAAARLSFGELQRVREVFCQFQEMRKTKYFHEVRSLKRAPNYHSLSERAISLLGRNSFASFSGSACESLKRQAFRAKKVSRVGDMRIV